MGEYSTSFEAMFLDKIDYNRLKLAAMLTNSIANYGRTHWEDGVCLVRCLKDMVRVWHLILLRDKAKSSKGSKVYLQNHYSLGLQMHSWTSKNSRVTYCCRWSQSQGDMLFDTWRSIDVKSLPWFYSTICRNGKIGHL